MPSVEPVRADSKGKRVTTDTGQRGFEVFLEVHRGLPRQGPGSDAVTARALSCCVGMPRHPQVLDIGCGPGRQTVTLAKSITGRITAVDLHREYLEELAALAADEGVRNRIEIVCADMNELPFAAESFDLLWSEGAAYIMGFAQALTAWRPLLRPGGCVAVSEIVWLRPEPPPALSQFFAEEYPAMTSPTSRFLKPLGGNSTTLRSSESFLRCVRATRETTKRSASSTQPNAKSTYGGDSGTGTGTSSSSPKETGRRRKWPKPFEAAAGSQAHRLGLGASRGIAERTSFCLPRTTVSGAGMPSRSAVRRLWSASTPAIGSSPNCTMMSPSRTPASKAAPSSSR